VAHALANRLVRILARYAVASGPHPRTQKKHRSDAAAVSSLEDIRDDAADIDGELAA